MVVIITEEVETQEKWQHHRDLLDALGPDSMMVPRKEQTEKMVVIRTEEWVEIKGPLLGGICSLDTKNHQSDVPGHKPHLLLLSTWFGNAYCLFADAMFNQESRDFIPQSIVGLLESGNVIVVGSDIRKDLDDCFSVPEGCLVDNHYAVMYFFNRDIINRPNQVSAVHRPLQVNLGALEVDRPS